MCSFSFQLKEHSEYTVEESGIYLIAIVHSGVISQNLLSAISLGSNHDSENKWYPCRFIISDFVDPYVKIEYNSYLKKIRNITDYKRKITLIKIAN